MLSFIKGSCISGIEGKIVNIETDITNGIPYFELVGVMNNVAKDSRERVRAAVKNSGFIFPRKKILVNVSPADLRKGGTYFDLPIAIGLLLASNQIKYNKLDFDISNYIFFGELSLDGSLKVVKGVLPMVIEAKKQGFEGVVLPLENAMEASVVKGIRIIAVANLFEAVGVLESADCSKHEDLFSINKVASKDNHKVLDFKDVKGQNYAKRALEVAAAGGHNILMVGAPGSGKTMMAQRIPSILPDLIYDEMLETSIIHSIAGLLPEDGGLITERPFRAPHYNSTAVSLIGGGRYPKPGEVSISHNGVLFLDELSEFRSDVVESLREPLQERHITLNRLEGSVIYPASFMLVAATNPCKCGKLLEKNKKCTCTPAQILSYRNRLSGALLDRIDIKVEVTSTDFSMFTSNKIEESSETIRNRVVKCRRIQMERFKGYKIYCNSQMDQGILLKACKLSNESEAFIKSFCSKNDLSTRAYISVLKVARTIADLDGSASVSKKHIAEALQYRVKLEVGEK